MQIQISTDHNIECHEALDSRVRGVVETALRRNSDHITRVEIHMSDESSNKKGGIDVMRCVMEARLERHQPIAVTHRAETLDHAVHGAVGKLTRLIEHTIGRKRSHKAHEAVAPLETPEEKEDS
jgi:ribosome-associated translation inhibitor RaiA